MVTDPTMPPLDERRQDKAFMGRIAHRMREDAPLLERLKDGECKLARLVESRDGGSVLVYECECGARLTRTKAQAEADSAARQPAVTAQAGEQPPYPPDSESDRQDNSGAPWVPDEGDYAQKIKHGSNVHICLTAAPDEYGVKVTMACGASWYSGVLDHVSEYFAQQRPCRKCWEAM